MKYQKPALTFDAQADQLIARGLVAERGQLIEILSSVNYYRLSGYLFRFRDSTNPDLFVEGTNLDEAWDHYIFDRKLRVLMMDAIERIEIAIRTALANTHAQLHGPFGYCKPEHLPNLGNDRFGNFLAKLDEAQRHNSREVFVKHFEAKYGDTHHYLPVWMAVEIMNFGTTLTFYRGVEKGTKRHIASRFDISDDVLTSWLLSMNSIRNVCAHHGRLWNRTIGTKPMIPRQHYKHPDWHVVQLDNTKIFASITVALYMLRIIAPRSKWKTRFENLLDAHPNVPLPSMGIPPNWREIPIWKT